MSEKVILEFDVDGSSNVEAQGFKGKSCTDVTAPFEQALGKVESDTKKPEFYERPRTQTRNQS